MPSADFCTAVSMDYSTLSLYFKDTVQTSRGKTQSFPRVNAGFIKHIPIADGGLRGHVPTRPGCTTPQIRFLYVAPRFWIVEDPELVAGGFLQTSPHDDALALLLAFGSAKTWHEDFHLASSVPCPAHTVGVRGRACLRQG
jgi:hypothetical protein